MTLVVAGGVIATFSFAIAMVWLTILAFKKSLWWGLACVFFFPLPQFVFLVMNFESCRRPLIPLCISLGISLLGGVIFGIMAIYGLMHQ